jgi:hypothetical protein
MKASQIRPKYLNKILCKLFQKSYLKFLRFFIKYFFYPSLDFFALTLHTMCYVFRQIKLQHIFVVYFFNKYKSFKDFDAKISKNTFLFSRLYPTVRDTEFRALFCHFKKNAI